MYVYICIYIYMYICIIIMVFNNIHKYVCRERDGKPCQQADKYDLTIRSVCQCSYLSAYLSVFQ